MSAISLGSKNVSGSLLAGNDGFATSYQHIQSITVGSLGASSVTFSEIPQNYRHLQVRGVAKVNGTSIGFGSSPLVFNGDTSTNYSDHSLFGDGASVSSSNGTNANSIYLGYVVDSASLDWSAHVMDILDYSNTIKFKTSKTLAGFDRNGSGRVIFRSGNWRSTSAITSITITAPSSGTFSQNTTFSLYGVK